ncbi:MAG: hypothetical protein LBG92_04075 [Prevotellaceae bacterium]|nr:hypothetical protein [Prevotellaceae bacterium]
MKMKILINQRVKAENSEKKAGKVKKQFMKSFDLKDECAKNFGATETETIQKNGTILKNQTSRENFFIKRINFMKKFIAIFFLFSMAIAASAQDVIFMKNGDEIKGKVTEITETSVRFKKLSNENGPVYSEWKSKVSKIRYENGDEDVFDEPAKPAETKLQTPPAGTARKAETSVVNVKKFYVDAGLSLFFMSNHSFGGGSIGISYYLNDKHLLSFDFSGGEGDSKDIGNFSYTITERNGATTTTTTHYDGIITRDVSLSNVLLSYHYLTGVYNSKTRWRFGAGAGSRTISARDEYSPSSVQGVQIEGIPKDRHKKSKSSPAVAASVGLTWNFAQRWFADFNYRAIVSSVSTVDEEKYGGFTSNLRLLVGFRF